MKSDGVCRPLEILLTVCFSLLHSPLVFVGVWLPHTSGLKMHS